MIELALIGLFILALVVRARPPALAAPESVTINVLIIQPKEIR